MMKSTALQALIAALAVIMSIVSAAALEDGARMVEIVGLWGAAFAAGASTAMLVSGLRRGRGPGSLKGLEGS